jgi:hypothetical protein
VHDGLLSLEGTCRCYALDKQKFLSVVCRVFDPQLCSFGVIPLNQGVVI